MDCGSPLPLSASSLLRYVGVMLFYLAVQKALVPPEGGFIGPRGTIESRFLPAAEPLSFQRQTNPFPAGFHENVGPTSFALHHFKALPGSAGVAPVTFLASLIVMTVVPVYLAGWPGYSSCSRLMQVKGDMNSLESGLEYYRLRSGTYPADSQGLDALVNKQIIHPPLRDPWGNKYLYRSAGSRNPAKPEIISIGPDGVLGSPDDLSN